MKRAGLPVRGRGVVPASVDSISAVRATVFADLCSVACGDEHGPERCGAAASPTRGVNADRAPSCTRGSPAAAKTACVRVRAARRGRTRCLRPCTRGSRDGSRPTRVWEAAIGIGGQASELTSERPSYYSCIVHLLHAAHQIQAHTKADIAEV